MRFGALLLLIASAWGQPPTHVFIVSGQSNAMGYADRMTLCPSPGTWVSAQPQWIGRCMLSEDSQVQYQHPTTATLGTVLFNNYNSGLYPTGVSDVWAQFADATTSTAAFSFGPELSFIWNWTAEHPGVPMAVIKSAVGGTDIDFWLSGSGWLAINDQIAQAKTRFAASGTSYVWDSMLWMQGESGALSCGSTGTTTYATKLRQFLANVRAATSADLRVGIGRISNSVLADNMMVVANIGGCTAAQSRTSAEWRRTLQVQVGGDTGNFWWDNDNLPVYQSQTPDPSLWWHFIGDGYLAMGERAYNAWKTGNPYPAGRKTIRHGGPMTGSGGVSIR